MNGFRAPFRFWFSSTAAGAKLDGSGSDCAATGHSPRGPEGRDDNGDKGCPSGLNALHEETSVAGAVIAGVHHFRIVAVVCFEVKLDRERLLCMGRGGVAQWAARSGSSA